VSEAQRTTADVERLQGALHRERDSHKATRAVLKRLQDEIMPRLATLEQERQQEPPNLAVVTGGLASIRADLRAEIAAMRQELADLADELHQFTRQP